MVWYPIQLCYPCLWENLWACSFLSLLEATASSTPSRPTQLTRPFCPSHLSCPVLPSGGSRRPDTSRPLPKPQGIALNRISVSFDCLQGGFRDANFISLGLGVGERLSVLYKTHPPWPWGTYSRQSWLIKGHLDLKNTTCSWKLSRSLVPPPRRRSRGHLTAFPPTLNALFPYLWVKFHCWSLNRHSVALTTWCQWLLDGQSCGSPFSILFQRPCNGKNCVSQKDTWMSWHSGPQSVAWFGSGIIADVVS